MRTTPSKGKLSSSNTFLPDKDAIQAAYAKGNVSVTPSDAASNDVKIVIVNYVKPGDSMTLLFDKEQKQVRSVKIASYVDSPSDAMNLAVQFDRRRHQPRLHSQNRRRKQTANS